MGRVGLAARAWMVARIAAPRANPTRPTGPTCLALVLSLLLPACAARTSTPTVNPTQAPDAADQLRRDLTALFRAAAVDHVQWGVTFYSVRRDAMLYTLNETTFMVPASNQKLLITAAAAERLGWDFRFTTRLLSTAPIGADGTIDGDLIVAGNGDPTINTRDAQRWRAFDEWAAALKAKGIHTIKGRLIGDDNAFVEPGWGVGWAWDNLQYGYGAPATALQFNENQVELLVGPGMAPGVPAIISMSPAGSGLVVDNRVSTAEAGQPTSIDIARVPGTPNLVVRGQVAAGARPAGIFASVDDPTRFYLNTLRSALSRYGITVDGGILDADALPAPLSMAHAHELLIDRSTPLSEIIDVALKWSRNIYAESMLSALASPEEPATGTRGLRTVAETLGTWGIAPDKFLARDGSGLSRYDYIGAATIAALLRHMLADPRHAEKFQASLAVAGTSGTLAERMKGTPAEGRVRGKTGTLSNVRSLSGYLTTLDGDTVVFAMMANNFRVGAGQIDAIMDGAINRVVQFK